MSVAEVLEARRILLEPGAAQRYPRSWLPLLDRGAGYTPYVSPGRGEETRWIRALSTSAARTGAGARTAAPDTQVMT